MELKDYLEIGAKKAGSLTALGKYLDMSQPTISGAKAHKRPLTTKAAVQLANYIGEDVTAVIAANELVTEKDESKRAFWSLFVEHARAASVALALTLVTNFLTPTQAEAATNRNSHPETVYIMSNRTRQRHSEKPQLLRRVWNGIERLLEALQAILTTRINQIQTV